MKFAPLFAAFLIGLATPAVAQDALPGLHAVNPALSAADIIQRAHEAAGGENWRRPGTLALRGHAVMYRDGGEFVYDDYEMLRDYEAEKKDAHQADGKVRIEAVAGGETVFILAYDGKTTYDQNGPVADQSANARWAANFGFGAIRHALDEGWTQKRLPDDLIDGRLAYMVELTDPSGGVTRFGIAQDDYAIVYVGFDTPRGWHERRYANFFKKPGVDWVQPGRVRLYYNGVKQNEVIWTDFDVGKSMPDSLFVVSKGE